MSSKYDDDREQKRRALKDGEWACVDSKCAKVNEESLLVCDEYGKREVFDDFSPQKLSIFSETAREKQNWQGAGQGAGGKIERTICS